jgi:hypothetical protein
LSSGLIGQVAEDLWEVENKTIRNLTREGIDIKEYKAGLVKKSEYLGLLFLHAASSDTAPLGMKQIEKLQAKKGSLV